jgi:hypothetical protein
MLPFLTAQVLYFLYAFFIGNKECEYILERKKYAPHDSPYDDPFHTFGYLAAGVVVAACVLFQSSIAGYILSAPLGVLIIWIVYDVVVGAGAFDNKYYLGTTANTDKWLLKHFGKDAGKRKVQIGLGVVGLLNLLYLFV